MGIGSSKGNVGHSLVAAGFAGLGKLLLSMENNMIAPTPIDDSEKVHENVVTQPKKWNDNDKYAGLSAFGFGGTNAHMIINKSKSYSYENNVKTFKSKALSIIGM